MKNLLNFFLKYNYWFLFVLLEIISFALLFRFNSYQGSAFFTSANFVSGAMYDAANNVTGYFHPVSYTHLDVYKRQMLFSTVVDPHWFQKGNNFWFEYKTSEGTFWYVVDPAARRCV